MIEVRVEGVLLEKETEQPVVLLRERDGNRVLPVFVGPHEAQAIVYVLSSKPFARPLTVDLMNLLVAGLRGTVRRVIVTRLEGGTYFAEIVLDSAEGTVSVDARPSDAIALALRAGAPILVAEAVMEEAGSVAPPEMPSKANELRAQLRAVMPEDFGDYEMQ